MSTAVGLDIGKVIFNVLKNSALVMAVPDMHATKIQPAPMLAQTDPTIGVLYEISAVNPVNIKREYRNENAALYIVDFSIQAFSTEFKRRLQQGAKVLQ